MNGIKKNYTLIEENQKFLNMKKRSEIILDEICKRFRGNTKWDELLFSNEDSKYYSLLIISKLSSHLSILMK